MNEWSRQTVKQMLGLNGQLSSLGSAEPLTVEAVAPTWRLHSESAAAAPFFQKSVCQEVTRLTLS